MQMGKKELPGVMEIFCILTAVVVTQLFTFVKTQTAHLKMAGFYNKQIIPQ